MSDWMNTAVLCGNGSMESGEWMSLSVQSNVSHSSSIKVKDSGDRAERSGAQCALCPPSPPSARAQDKSRHVQTVPDSPSTRASVEGSRRFHNYGKGPY